MLREKVEVVHMAFEKTYDTETIWVRVESLYILEVIVSKVTQFFALSVIFQFGDRCRQFSIRLVSEIQCIWYTVSIIHRQHRCSLWSWNRKPRTASLERQKRDSTHDILYITTGEILQRLVHRKNACDYNVDEISCLHPGINHCFYFDSTKASLHLLQHF